MAATAVGTAGLSIAVDETDRAHLTGHRLDADGKVIKEEGMFREGTDHAKILKDGLTDGAMVLAGGAVAKGASTFVKGAVVNGTEVLTNGQKVARATITATGDMATGAAAEYVQTGEVTVQGTITNGLMSGVGSSVQYSRTIQNGLVKIKNSFGDAKNAITGKFSMPKSEMPKTMFDADGNILVGGGTSSGLGGFFARLKEKFSPSTPLEKMNAAKNQRAIDNGLNEVLDPKLAADITERMNRKGTNHFISDATTGNVVSDRLIKALEMKNQAKSFVTRLKDNIDLNNISQHIENGGVCNVNGKLYINDNGVAKPIKMSQEKFEKLFSPLKCSIMQQQGGTHICAVTAKINGMLETPSGRAKLYTMLEDTGDGILVHLNHSTVNFPGGKPVKLNGTFMKNAPDGIQMLEQAFMTTNLKKAAKGEITSIKDFSVKALTEQSILTENRRSFHDVNSNFASSGTTNFKTHTYGKGQDSNGTYRENAREELERIFQDFVPGQDIMTAHWNHHAKTVVNYDPATQIVTYRDPMSPGVDTQCTFVQFLNKGHHSYGLEISFEKGGKPSGRPSVSSTQTKTNSAAATPTASQTHTPTPTPSQTATPAPSQAPKRRYTLDGENTGTARQQDPVQTPSQTSNTTGTNSTQVQKTRIASSNLKEIATLNGKPVMARNVGRSGDVFTIEVNGKSYDIAVGQTIRTKEGVTLKGGKYGVTSEIPATSTPKPTKVQPRAEVPKPEVKQSRVSTPATAPKAAAASNEIVLGHNALVVARTAEGNPIVASVTNSNVVIIKDGKRTVIPIPEMGETIPILESSTDSFLIIKNDNGKVSIVPSETPDLPEVEQLINNSAPTVTPEQPAVKQNPVNTPRETVSPNSAAQTTAPKPEAAGHETSLNSRVEQPQPRIEQSKVEPKVNEINYRLKTDDEIYDALDEIGSRLSAKRKVVKEPFDKQIQNLQNQLSQSEISFNELNTKYKTQIKQKTEEISQLKNRLLEDRDILNYWENKAPKLEQQAIEYRSALYDLEKAHTRFIESDGIHGSHIDELYAFAETKQKRFIGAEIKGNTTEKVVPENPPSYYYSEDIANTFHAYNTTQGKNKINVLHDLRLKVEATEKALAKAKAKVSTQQTIVNDNETQLSSAYSERNNLESSYDNAQKEYYETKKSLTSQIEVANQTKEQALNEVKSSQDYRELNNEYKELQGILRERNNS